MGILSLTPKYFLGKMGTFTLIPVSEGMLKHFIKE